MTPKVSDMIELMEEIAPPDLAEAWDNCGLQIGDNNQPVKKIWIALDPLLEVVESAAKHHVDLIITHHPLMIKPVRSIDLNSNLGKIISLSLEHHIAIYSAHTNLDSVLGGVNDMLAKAIGLNHVHLLSQNRNENERELSPHGIGRVGELSAPLSLIQFAADIKNRLKLEHIKLSGENDLTIKKVAICSGSGSSFLKAFFSSGADAYISGDLKYHDARDAQEKGLALIDIGHYASEHIFIDVFVKRLQKIMVEKNFSGSVNACNIEKEPFIIV